MLALSGHSLGPLFGSLVRPSNVRNGGERILQGCLTFSVSSGLLADRHRPVGAGVAVGAGGLIAKLFAFAAEVIASSARLAATRPVQTRRRSTAMKRQRGISPRFFGLLYTFGVVVPGRRRLLVIGKLIRSTVAAAWRALNSPFVLFLLGSVVLTAVTQFYAAERASGEARTTARRELVSIELEMNQRLTTLDQAAAPRLSKQRSQGRILPIAPRDKALMLGVLHGDPPFEATDPAFAHLSLLALMLKADLVVGDRLSLEPIVSTSTSGAQFGPKDGTPAAAAHLIERDLLGDDPGATPRSQFEDLMLVRLYAAHREYDAFCATGEKSPEVLSTFESVVGAPNGQGAVDDQACVGMMSHVKQLRAWLVMQGPL